jgi:hypothetical protein
MTVGQLREILEDLPDDAEVKLMTQQHYPFENGIRGVCQRSDFTEDEYDKDASEAQKHAARVHAKEDPDSNPEDVFIVEGAQLCYGNKNAWDAARS